MMREDIIMYLQQEVLRRCELPSNFFGMGCFYHIQAVVKNAGLLAKQYHANQEVVLIAAWLHDIASVTDYEMYEEHHLYSAEIAKELLTEWNYDLDKMELVCQCIRNHRGSVQKERITAEELCVADADAISHFDNVPSLLYLAYVKRNMDIESGREFVKNKLDRSFAKLSVGSKEIYRDKYEQVMHVLKSS